MRDVVCAVLALLGAGWEGIIEGAKLIPSSCESRKVSSSGLGCRRIKWLLTRGIESTDSGSIFGKDDSQTQDQVPINVALCLTLDRGWGLK
jgi:hypothetical protein